MIIFVSCLVLVFCINYGFKFDSFFFKEHLRHYIIKTQNEHHKINILNIYGKSNRKFASAFLNAYILSLHNGFQHDENPFFEYFNHKGFPENGFPFYVELKDDVEETMKVVQFYSCVKGKKQKEMEKFKVRLWKQEIVPSDYIKTIEIDNKSVKFLSTNHFVPSWLKQ